MRYELLLFSTLLSTIVSGFNTQRHCSDPETLPTISWSNYSQLLEYQTGTLLFGSYNEPGIHQTDITREEIYVPDDDSTAICKPKFVYNIDTFRKPSRLMEQTCENEMVFKEGRLYICRPISLSFSVLRRASCHRGVRTYDRVWEHMHVGCAAYLTSENVIEQRESRVVANE